MNMLESDDIEALLGAEDTRGVLDVIVQGLPPLRHYYKQAFQTLVRDTPTAKRLMLYRVTLASSTNKELFGLKYLNADETTDRSNNKRYFGKHCNDTSFAREVQAHKMLDPLAHPNILPLAESHVIHKSGAGLLIYRRKQQFKWKVLRNHTRDVMRQVFEALAACHANGVIHRDVKPKNFVWAWNGSKPRMYLIDFGVCAFTKEWEKATIRLDHSASGTYRYMSPEIWEFTVSSDPTVTDSWAAGIMFAELLLNRKRGLGFVGDPKEVERFNRHKRQEMFKPIDPTARDLLDKLLEIDPDERITCSEALKHPYFNQSPSVDCTVLSSVTRSNRTAHTGATL